jgi:hypothetical protein
MHITWNGPGGEVPSVADAPAPARVAEDARPVKDEGG